MRLTVVGCAGSFPAPGSAASSYLVQATDADGRLWRIVLDLGSGALGPLQQHVDLRTIDAVLLSHLHPDHCLDLCGLYVALRYDPAGPFESRIPVYGPSHTFERLEQAYGEHETGSLALAFDVRAWSDGDAVAIGPFTLTPRRVRHPVEAYGVRVETPGASLAYSGDTDECDALVALAQDVDLLLAEAAFVEGREQARGVHLTGLRAGRAAAQARAQRLLLTHLPVWTPAEAVLAEARSAYDRPVEVAYPGLSLELATLA